MKWTAAFAAAFGVAFLLTIVYSFTVDVKEAKAATVTGDLYYFHNDYIGRPFMMTDSTPEPIWYADYYPFGEVMYENGSIEVGDPATTGITWKPNFRFPGQYQDEETGMFYNHNRYYMPDMGRYNRVDPLYKTDGITYNSIYSYVSNNPIIFSDFWGLQSKECMIVEGKWVCVREPSPYVKTFGSDDTIRAITTVEVNGRELHPHPHAEVDKKCFDDCVRRNYYDIVGWGSAVPRVAYGFGSVSGSVPSVTAAIG